MAETRKPDALLVPRNLEQRLIGDLLGRRVDPNADMAHAYDRAFREILNPETAPRRSGTGDPVSGRSAAVRVRDSAGHRFVSLDPRAFPRDSSKQSYYRWVEQTAGPYKGILFGFLLDPEVPPYPSLGPAPLPPQPPGGATFTSGGGEDD